MVCVEAVKATLDFVSLTSLSFFYFLKVCGGGPWFGSAAEGPGWGTVTGNSGKWRSNWPQLHRMDLIVSLPSKMSSSGVLAPWREG